MTVPATNVPQMSLSYLQVRKMSDVTLEGYKSKLKGRLYGLLCEKEKNGEWEKFLDTIVIEIRGLEPEERSINYWALLAKLQSLRYLSYEYFRKTIFECMNLVGDIEQ